ncbi:MAG: alpha/beta fold hydrolase [Gemmatimonadaceae bacterium]
MSYPRLRSGLKVRVVERGDPQSPSILFIHGWGCTVYVFHRNMPAIAEAGFRTIAVDLKGHGLSDKPTAPDEFSVDSLVEHVRDIMDVLELEQTVLAGHSLGGSLAFHFAARYPARVRRLALLSPVGMKGVPLMWFYRALTPRFLDPLFQRVRSPLLVQIALWRVYGRRGRFTKRDVEELFAPSQFPEYSVAVRELLHAYDWNAAKTRPLKTLDIPAIGVWGTRDHLMPADGMGSFIALLPRIVLSAIPDAGHAITMETPTEVNAALLALLRTNFASGAAC